MLATITTTTTTEQGKGLISAPVGHPANFLSLEGGIVPPTHLRLPGGGVAVEGFFSNGMVDDRA